MCWNMLCLHFITCIVLWMNTLLKLRGIFVNFYNYVPGKKHIYLKKLEMVNKQFSQFYYLYIKSCMDLVLDYVQFAEWNMAISHCMCMRWLKELNEFETVICNVFDWMNLKHLFVLVLSSKFLGGSLCTRHCHLIRFSWLTLIFL